MRVLGERVDLADLTTLRLGGPAARFSRAGTADEIIAGVREADRAGQPLLVLGGGSNLVVADAGFDGSVLQVASRGIAITGADPEPGPARAAGDRALKDAPGARVRLTVAAGEDWDRIVEWSVSENLAGIECLSGIPGLTGSTPIQNVGAYGQDVAAAIESVTVLDRATGVCRVLTGPECGFGYRASVFKSTPWPPARPAEAAGTARPGPTGRFVVLDVALSLTRSHMSVPIRYAELAARLGIAVGERAPLGAVRQAVLGLRRGKGMVLDPADPDSVSAGSFFTNPVLDAAQFARLEAVAARRAPRVSVPRYPAGPGLVKVPAAWLIEQAGFGKGYPGHGPVRISAKHTLALTNAGGATTADLLGLARHLVAGVLEAFGVVLASEPVLVGVAL